MTESFAELFEQSIASQRIRPGTILNGLIVEVGQDYVIVNVGLKSEAVIPSDQFKNEKGEIEVTVGETVEVALDSVEDGSGETRLSREKAKRARTWTRLETAFEKQEVVIGIITGRVKGGFTVEIDNVLKKRFFFAFALDCLSRTQRGHYMFNPLDSDYHQIPAVRQEPGVCRFHSRFHIRWPFFFKYVTRRP